MNVKQLGMVGKGMRWWEGGVRRAGDGDGGLGRYSVSGKDGFCIGYSGVVVPC